MPHFFEWLLVLFQPMKDAELQAKLHMIGMPEGYLAIIPMFIFLLFLVGVISGATVRGVWRDISHAEYVPLMCVMLGAAAAVGFMWPHMRMTLQLFSAPDEALKLAWVDLPSFHAYHRAALPFDIVGFKQLFLPGNFERKLKLSFYFWQEDSRGLYIYPLIAIACALPGVRRIAQPFLAGAFMLMAVLPILIGPFLTSFPAGVGSTALLFVFSGGLSWWLRFHWGKG